MKSQMTYENVYRFRTLIEFLWQLPGERFDFAALVSKADEHGCGTVCCGLGWTPALFPELVEWRYNAVFLKHADKNTLNCFSLTISSAALFGLSDREAYHCFGLAETNSDGAWGVLTEDTTPQQLAAHLESFLAGKIAAGEAPDIIPAVIQPSQPKLEPATA